MRIGVQHALAARQRSGRGLLRRLLEVRGLVGGHQAPHERVELAAADGTTLVASHLPGPTDQAPGLVLAHGFAAHRRKPAYAYLADVLAGFVHVLSLDLRGHGDSGGHSAFGGRERLDVAAGLRWLRHHGGDWGAAVGMSMGGSAVLHALAEGADADAAVVVSTPAHTGRIETEAMALLDDLWRTWWKRLGYRVGTGVRMVPPGRWQSFPHPIELVSRLRVPLLVVHGEDDHYFPVGNAELLWEAAGERATLWREPAGFGHAEDGVTPAFAVRLGEALLVCADIGRFPERDEIVPRAATRFEEGDAV